MSEWQARRFWTDATARPVPGGWEVMLDGRALRTPGKQPLVLPTAPLAEAIAGEWQAQGAVIAPLTMPLTRAANSAVERVGARHADVAAMLAAYGATDLLSYRADGPPALEERQAAGWDPLLDWALSRWDGRLRVTRGVIPIDQDAALLGRMGATVAALDSFGLTALHDLVTLPGSLVLGLAVIEGRLTAAGAHTLARIDEDFQAERWGRDPEAEEAAAGRLAAMQSAERLWHLSRPVAASDSHG